MDLEKERAAFEFWYSSEGMAPKAIARGPGGDGYKLIQAQMAWVAWWARAALAPQQQPAPAMGEELPLSDDEIEATAKACGVRWEGSYWIIEDADLHPFARACMALRQPAAVAVGEGITDPVFREWCGRNGMWSITSERKAFDEAVAIGRATAPIIQPAAPQPEAKAVPAPSTLSDDDYCALEYAIKALRAISERKELIGDTIEPLNNIRTASGRATHALNRLQPVAHRLMTAPVSQPAAPCLTCDGAPPYCNACPSAAQPGGAISGEQES